ncbi:2-dehydropantoate 2-reductase [Priestia endophytica]|jgi:2-dehydropantoate 2-reductase|uniref:2-dehydropantoate 2-reductase n=1 Tax=Priestia endophytica TaxID=135735 RepID=A0AAX1QDH4_9BACI|nr:2-dehydropantoate 2-reductase [Priestia endophytica]MCM3539378.1 2-dehydropantoate 2-reductase [Priestia endophytica]RAS79410.1 2-dehydropantoate 2-reductase [Priestia endophytica]RAS84083.1 2-dehydropantoate 2-reductase [Priestia endophytica]
MEKLDVIGGGSLGLLYAGYLSEQWDVTLYTKTEEQANAIKQKGILVYKEASLRFFPKVKPISSYVDEGHLAVVTLKEYQLSSVMPILKATCRPLLFIQNGMNHLKMLDKLTAEHVFLGVVEHGALRLNENTVHHKGEGKTKVSVWRGEKTFLSSLLRYDKRFPFVYEHDWKEMLLGKLVINILVNPLTALYKVENGVLLENLYFLKNMRALLNEVHNVLELKDVESTFKNVLTICKNTKDNRSSMLQDLQNRGITEIDAIVGYVLEEAERKKIKTPLLSFLYASIKGLEKGES